MKNRLLCLSAIALAASSFSVQSNAATACVFDLMGTNGPTYNLMKDYALQAKSWGVNMTLKAYTDERVASEDFAAKKCDVLSATGMRARKYNKFVGSLDAIGAAPSKKVTYEAMKLIADPKLASKMKSNGYEVLGTIPLGAAYLFVDDRSIDTVAKAAGKRFAVLDHDKSQAKMVARLGAQPVSSDITTFAGKFNNGQVDMIGAPAMAYKPLELAKGLGTKGAIIKFPILQVTNMIVAHDSAFTDAQAQNSREWFAGQLPAMFKMIQRDENDIPAKYWHDIPANDEIGYVKLMRDGRMSMTAEGDYDPSMMKLLKKVRCQVNPASFECSLQGE